MNVKWTEEEKQYIVDNAAHMKDAELAKRLTENCQRTVTLDAVRKVRQKLGIKKKHGRGICALVYSPVETAAPGLSEWENEGGLFQTVSDRSSRIPDTQDRTRH